ncbi:MAG TPA: LapA family protein [Hyphomicrobiales bacterium]|nr:LapA family protein [Hyphomicrobiales bacterium]
MPLTLVIILFIFIGALIWLVNWEPDSGDKKDDKNLRDDIKKLFDDMKANARTYNRDEFVPSLESAYDEVVKVLKDHGH